MTSEQNKDAIALLIKKHLNWHPTELQMASAKYFVDSGKVSGGLYLSIKRIAQEYAAETKKPEGGWVSVEKRLPDESGRYWCYVQEINDLGISHFQWNCYFNAERKHFTDSTMTDGEKVTHWMPLPSPPTNN